jgi:hypothetical protein
VLVLASLECEMEELSGEFETAAVEDKVSPRMLTDVTSILVTPDDDCSVVDGCVSSKGDVATYSNRVLEVESSVEVSVYHILQPGHSLEIFYPAFQRSSRLLKVDL